MQVMSAMPDTRIHGIKSPLHLSDMRAGGYVCGELLQVLYCIVPTVTRFNNSCDLLCDERYER